VPLLLQKYLGTPLDKIKSIKKLTIATPLAFVTAFAKAIFVALQVATIRYLFPLEMGKGPK
jgi:hypothetical protein